MNTDKITALQWLLAHHPDKGQEVLASAESVLKNIKKQPYFLAGTGGGLAAGIPVALAAAGHIPLTGAALACPGVVFLAFAFYHCAGLNQIGKSGRLPLPERLALWKKHADAWSFKRLFARMFAGTGITDDPAYRAAVLATELNRVFARFDAEWQLEDVLAHPAEKGLNGFRFEGIWAVLSDPYADDAAVASARPEFLAFITAYDWPAHIRQGILNAAAFWAEKGQQDFELLREIKEAALKHQTSEAAAVYRDAAEKFAKVFAGL